jgi:hypothetical protein
MQEHLFLGDHFLNGAPLLIPYSTLARHALVYGPPGFGKTVLVGQIATQLIATGNDVIVIDCKGSAALLNNLLDEAYRPNDTDGKPLYRIKVFNPFKRFPSHIYNPFLQKIWLEQSVTSRITMLLNAFGIYTSEGDYGAFFAAMAAIVGLDFLTWFPELQSLAELYKLINDRHLYSAKGGDAKDWGHSRHLTAKLRQLLSCEPLNAIPKSPSEFIELIDAFVGDRPFFGYFYIAANEDPMIADVTGRLLLQQLQVAAVYHQFRDKGRKAFVICDEAQQLFGPMFGNFLEQMRQFNIGVLMFHQSRAQLITPVGDFRERFEGAVGMQMSLGAVTATEIEYLQKTDREKVEYLLSWNQPLLGSGNNAMLHPRYSYQPDPIRHPQLMGVHETKVPRLDRGLILDVSSHPQAGFVRCSLNDKLWAYNGAWVPFRMYHHLTKKEFDDFGAAYPKALPGQTWHSPNASELSALLGPSEARLGNVTTDVPPVALIGKLEELAQQHRQRRNEPE